MLDPKCAMQLQCDQILLGIFTEKLLSESSHNSLLAFLNGLPPALTLLKDCNSTSVRCQDLIPIHERRKLNVYKRNILVI